MLVELADDEAPTGSRPLGRTFAIQLLADADAVIPDHIVLDHTNQPFAHVKVVTATPGDSATSLLTLGPLLNVRTDSAIRRAGSAVG